MKTNIPGITYRSDKRRYVVRKYKNGKEISIGSFLSIEEAKKALETGAEFQQNSETPILDALRSEFNVKKTNKQTPGAILMGSQKKLSKPVKSTNSKKENKVTSHSPKTKLVVREKHTQENLQTTTDFSVGSVTELNVDSLTSVHGKATLHLILKYLLKEAEVRETTVFDVVAQEVKKVAKTMVQAPELK